MKGDRHRTKAPSLGDLLFHVMRTYSELGPDARWIGRNDGDISIWRDDYGPLFIIQSEDRPSAKNRNTEDGK